MGWLVAAVLLLVGVVLVGLVSIDRGDRRNPDGDGLVAADVDRNTPVPQPPALGADTDLESWAGGVAGRSGVPARALRAYGAAELAQRAATPDCRLSWATLAGIGRVESDHGRLGRSDLDVDGVARPRIVGVPLDGSSGVREVLDTDGGALDGDPTYDRAIGPMQFLPTTWARYGADGNGDGVRDPHQVDDAARAAARYLCAGDRDTASGQGWWDGCWPTTAPPSTPAWSGPPPTATPPPTPAPDRPRPPTALRSRTAVLRRPKSHYGSEVRFWKRAGAGGVRTRGGTGPSRRPRQGRRGRRKPRSWCAPGTPSSRRCWPVPAASARTARAGRA